MKSILLAVALMSSSAGVAAPPAPSAASQPAVDPERLALAKTAVAAIMPQGIMQKIMKDSMAVTQDAMYGSMFDMKGSDLGATGEGKEKTLRQVMADKDPHFEERLRITNKVMGEEMGAIMAQLEPAMRDGMARAYAKRFSVAELTEINRFFVSAAGSSFARQSFELMTDPELMKAMTSYMPEMMKQMPAIMEKVKKATAHLPPPPKEEKGEVEPDSDDDALEGADKPVA